MLRRTFTLGRYNCVERLKSGPLGETWRAKLYGPVGLEGQFAVERIHGHLVQDGAFLERLGAAVERYRGLVHPGIARLCEVGQKGPQQYLVFELVPGGPLQRLRPALLQALASQPGGRALLPRAVAALGRDLCEIVAYAHGRGARATGLSPATVLVDGAGRARVCDLGLAEARLAGAAEPPPDLAPLLPYLAPELRRGEAGDARADVFSIAAVLLDLLTGAPPPESALRPGGRLPTPADPTVPALWQALQQALQPRPGDRPPGAAELAALLAAVGPDEDVRALLGQLGPRLGRPEADPLHEAPGAADPLPPSPGERVLIASSAESTRTPRHPEPREAVVLAPPAVMQPLPVAAALALAPRQRAGVVLAVEEEEHTVPVPHSPKSKIRIMEAEPPGSRVGLGASLREPEPTPVRRMPGTNPGAEITAVPGMPGTSPGAEPRRTQAPDLWSVPSVAETDPGSGPSGLRPAAPVSRILPGRGEAGASSMDTPGTAALDLSDFDEPTALADYGQNGDLGGLTDPSGLGAGGADGAPSSISWELPDAPAPPRPTLADQFPPLITDPVPLVAPDEIEAELPFAGAGRSPVLPPPPPAPVAAPPVLAPAVSLPSLSKDDETFDDLLEEDEPTGSIPDAPARRLAEMMQDEAPRAPSKDTGPGVLPAWAPAAVLSAPLFPMSEPLAAVPEPLTSAPPFVPAPAPPVVTTAPVPVVSAMEPMAPAQRVTAPRPAARQRLVSPAVAISFVLALVVGGSAPILYRLLRPRPVVTVKTPPEGQRPEGPGQAVQRPAAPPETPPEAPAPPAKAGQLALASTPPGAAVFLDGKAAGKTPLSLPVGAGRHRLVLLLERHKLWKQEVQGGTPLDVKLEPTVLPAGVAGPAGLKVRCTTKGQLRILVDGHDTGYNCPTERIALSPGPHKVEFFRPRTGDTVARAIVVKKGKNTSTRLYTKY